MQQEEKDKLEQKINTVIDKVIQRRINLNPVHGLGDNQLSEYGLGIKSECQHWVDNIIPDIRDEIRMVICLHK